MPIAKRCVGASIGENGDWTIADADGNSNGSSNSNTVIPVANYVTTIEHYPVVMQDVCSSCGTTSTNSSNSHVVEVSEVSLVSEEDTAASNSSSAFDIPSVRCFVTEEDEARNQAILREQQKQRQHQMQMQQEVQYQQQQMQHPEQEQPQTPTPTQTPTKTITGAQLLARLKRNRKQATVRSGVIGGIVGLFLLGPIGAVGFGVGSAVLTKHRLKKREKTLRKLLEGRIDQPLPVVSSAKGCPYQSGAAATNCRR